MNQSFKRITAAFDPIRADFHARDPTVLCKNRSQSENMGRHLSAELMGPWNAQSGSRLSLIFRPGERPSASEIVQLANSGCWPARLEPAGRARAPGFAVSHQPGAAAAWLELLAGGMTFDLAGLAPGGAAPMPAMAHFYGLPGGSAAGLGEAISLVPGEQLRGAEKLLPVMRTMMGLAARLAELDGVTAVVWHPARSAMAPELFAAVIGNWLNGGPFPALGLTALLRDTDDAIYSEGLGFFIGQELRIEPLLGEDTTYYVKIATRLINELVGTNHMNQALDFLGPNGEQFSVEPSGSDGFMKVWRKT